MGIVTGKGLLALVRAAGPGTPPSPSVLSWSPISALSPPSSPAWRQGSICSGASAATSACRSRPWGSRCSCCFVSVVVLAAALVLIPGAPLVPILFLSQALNAVLLLVLLPLMRRLARDPAVMGEHVMGGAGRLLTGIALALVAVSVGTLAVLTVA